MAMPQCDTPFVCGLIIHSAFMLSAAQSLTLTLVLALRFCARSEIFDTAAFDPGSPRPNPTLLLVLLVVESVQL